MSIYMGTRRRDRYKISQGETQIFQPSQETKRRKSMADERSNKEKMMVQYRRVFLSVLAPDFFSLGLFPQHIRIVGD